MVRHIVAWNHKEEFTVEQRLAHAKEIKSQLEALKNTIKGIVKLSVYINPLESSGRDVILDSLFETAEALSAYQVHPEHKKAAAFVGSVMTERVCLDFEE